MDRSAGQSNPPETASGHSSQGLSWRTRFIPDLTVEEQRAVLLALKEGLTPDNAIFKEHSRVKGFYRVRRQGNSFFVKLRAFDTWMRRLGRGIRGTKEERELRNYVMLRSLGIPCPRPLASARLQKGPFLYASILVTEFLEGAVNLKESLLKENDLTVLRSTVELILLLRKAGLAHMDLQWENILVAKVETKAQLYLVDPLHLVFLSRRRQHCFAKSLAWFLRFMVAGGATREMINVFLQESTALGLCDSVRPQQLLEMALG